MHLFTYVPLYFAFSEGLIPSYNQPSDPEILKACLIERFVSSSYIVTFFKQRFILVVFCEICPFVAQFL